MFVLWRLAKLLIKLAVMLAVLLVAFVAWGNFWPKPSHPPVVRCPPHLHGSCRTVSGRVLFHTAFGRGRHAHLVLMSRSSLTLPGITSIELPGMAEPAGLSTGDWISVTGQRAKGALGLHGFHVRAIATSKVALSCGTPFNRRPCRRMALSH